MGCIHTISIVTYNATWVLASVGTDYTELKLQDIKWKTLPWREEEIELNEFLPTFLLIVFAWVVCKVAGSGID